MTTSRLRAGLLADDVGHVRHDGDGTPTVSGDLGLDALELLGVPPRGFDFDAGWDEVRYWSEDREPNGITSKTLARSSALG